MKLKTHRKAYYEKRREQFMPGGVPRKIRVYDNGGKTADRYTVVFTGNYTHLTGGEHVVLGMDSNPFHPLGCGFYNTYPNQIDRPTYSHLGKKIKFEDLPEMCRKWVVQNYEELWDIVPVDEYGERLPMPEK